MDGSKPIRLVCIGSAMPSRPEDVPFLPYTNESFAKVSVPAVVVPEAVVYISQYRLEYLRTGIKWLILALT